MQTFRFELYDLPSETQVLREEVRAFLNETLPGVPPVERAKSWSGFDSEFSRKMGAQGWIGMTWPKKYGGHERSAFERYVVLEEMLSAGGPVAAHWIADRQSGPLLIRYADETIRQEVLPKIARGEAFFCIGMSEPNSGSDLASVQVKAERVDGGWRVNGTKLWTTNAHRAHYMIGLFRTSTDPDDRHAGLSQFLVDLSWKGITPKPITDLAGDADFNEVHFEDVFIPETNLIGEEGNGWNQVTTELSYERSGPERYLSCYRLLVELIREVGEAPDARQSEEIGRLVAQLVTLRQMSLSVAAMLDAGENPNLEAATVKELGNLFEQSLPEAAHRLLDIEPTRGEGSDYQQILGYLTQVSPSFSLRGGTREILRGIIARGLGLR